MLTILWNVWVVKEMKKIIKNSKYGRRCKVFNIYQTWTCVNADGKKTMKTKRPKTVEEHEWGCKKRERERECREWYEKEDVNTRTFLMQRKPLKPRSLVKGPEHFNKAQNFQESFQSTPHDLLMYKDTCAHPPVTYSPRQVSWGISLSTIQGSSPCCNLQINFGIENGIPAHE